MLMFMTEQTCVVRAWDSSRPLLVAPAMNTHMWTHPLTAEQLARVQSFGVHVIAPVSKQLVCGDTGAGAMAEPQTICAAVRAHLPPALP